VSAAGQSRQLLPIRIACPLFDREPVIFNIFPVCAYYPENWNGRQDTLQLFALSAGSPLPKPGHRWWGLRFCGRLCDAIRREFPALG